MNRLRALGTVVAWAAVLSNAALAGCGDEAPGGESTASQILFDGSPGELLPHPTGRTSRFRVTARSGGESISSVVTTRVLSEGPDGEFLVESVSDGGTPRRRRVRETADEIRVEAIGTPGAEGFAWRELRPPAVLVRIPVVAGDPVETRFTRTVDVLLSVDGRREARTVTFEGDSVRTPRGRETLTLRGQSVDAIAVEIRGESDGARVSGLPEEDARIGLELRGTEHVAPGIGIVHEVLELIVRTLGAESRVEVESERVLGG